MTEEEIKAAAEAEVAELHLNGWHLLAVVIFANLIGVFLHI